MYEMTSNEFYSIVHEEVKSGKPDIEKIYDCLRAYGKTKNRRYFKSYLGLVTIPSDWEIIVGKPHKNYGNCVNHVHSKDGKDGSERFPFLLNEDDTYDTIRNIQCNKEKVSQKHYWISPTIFMKGKKEFFEACFELVVENQTDIISLNVRNVNEDKKQIETSPTFMEEWNKEIENVSENLINNSYQVEDLNVIRSMVTDLDDRIKNR